VDPKKLVDDGQEAGKRIGKAIRVLLGYPTDAERIVGAIERGVDRLAAVGETFARAEIMKAEAALLLACAEYRKADADYIRASAAYMAASAESGLHAAGAARAKAHADKAMAARQIVEVLDRLVGSCIDDFAVVIAEPLTHHLTAAEPKQIPAPGR
jgi:hypothetical protein